MKRTAIGRGRLEAPLRGTKSKISAQGRYNHDMEYSKRITLNPRVMGGKPCIRGMRVTVGTIVGLVATGVTDEKILQAYSYLEAEDIPAALTYAAWLAEASEVPLIAA